MGCISSTDVKQPKKPKGQKDNSKQIQPAMYKSKQLDKSSTFRPKVENTPQEQQTNNNNSPSQPAAPKILTTTIAKFLCQYSITSTLQQSTRLQGPKLITDKITGSTKVLKVYQALKINEERLKKYHEILGFQLYTDEEQNYLVVDEHCTGPSVSELFIDVTNEEWQSMSAEETRQKKQEIHEILLQIYDIIMKFHSKKVYLGNLNLFSFRKKSDFDNVVRLVEYNFEQKESLPGDREYFMGHAHHNSFQADWEFFGYLLQFYLIDKSPIFISHKMQYVENVEKVNEAEAQLIASLLKGRQIQRKQIEDIKVQNIILRNFHVLYGYKFCRDVIRLINARKRRSKHNLMYYSEEIFQHYRRRNQSTSGDEEFNEAEYFKLPSRYLTGEKLSAALGDEHLHKLESERIFAAVERYIEHVTAECEEHFINYSVAAENFRKLKEVFLIKDKNKKLQQLKDVILQIK